MASIYTSKAAPIRGPYLKHAFAKSVLKGEDAWLQQRDLQVSVPANAGKRRLISSTSIYRCSNGMLCYQKHTRMDVITLFAFIKSGPHNISAATCKVLRFFLVLQRTIRIGLFVDTSMVLQPSSPLVLWAGIAMKSDRKGLLQNMSACYRA